MFNLRTKISYLVMIYSNRNHKQYYQKYLMELMKENEKMSVKSISTFMTSSLVKLIWRQKMRTRTSCLMRISVRLNTLLESAHSSTGPCIDSKLCRSFKLTTFIATILLRTNIKNKYTGTCYRSFCRKISFFNGLCVLIQ